MYTCCCWTSGWQAEFLPFSRASLKQIMHHDNWWSQLCHGYTSFSWTFVWQGMFVWLLQALSRKYMHCTVTSLDDDCFDSHRLSLHKIVVTQGYHFSQNAVIGFQLLCPYIKNVLTMNVFTKKTYCIMLRILLCKGSMYAGVLQLLLYASCFRKRLSIILRQSSANESSCLHYLEAEMHLVCLYLKQEAGCLFGNTVQFLVSTFLCGIALPRLMQQLQCTNLTV